MTTILDSLMKAHYVATPAQVESLARVQYEAGAQAVRATGTYLRCLIARCQAKLGTTRRGKQPMIRTQLEVLEGVHAEFYPAVQRGVLTPDVMEEPGLDRKEASARALERNRRSTFARTSYATLKAFAEAGEDIRGLDANTVTKGELRAVLKPPEPEDKTARQVERSQSALLRAVKRVARKDAGAAREMLETAIEALQQELAAMEAAVPVAPDLGATTTVTGRRGVPQHRAPAQLHRGAA